MMKLLKQIRVSKSGASAAEYALILAVIGGGIVTAAVALKGSISGSIDGTSNVIGLANAQIPTTLAPATK